jgi:hypothetical protein
LKRIPSEAKAHALLGAFSAWSGRTMTRTRLRMEPTFPSSPLRFRTAGFPRYGFKAGLSKPPFRERRPRVAPSPFASFFRARRLPRFVVRSVSETPCAKAPACERPRRSTPGTPLRSGVCCPGPSSLNRPHPPSSRAQRDFAAAQLIRSTFALRRLRYYSVAKNPLHLSGQRPGLAAPALSPYGEPTFIL